MTWERYASVLPAFYKVVGNFRSSLEVHMHGQYADFYAFVRIYSVLCTKLPDLPGLIVPGSSSNSSSGSRQTSS
jgi:hypothetical protein